MSNKVIYAIYNDDDILMDAVKKLEQLIIISKKFYAFSCSRIRQSYGFSTNKISNMCLYGCVGITVATTMMNYIMIQDWPQDIGGKPVLLY
jgi:hypothetical protein